MNTAPGRDSLPSTVAATLMNDLAEAFRMAQRKLAASVHVVSVRFAGQSYGLTATAVSSLSMEPPSLLVCVHNAASIHSPLCSTERFCVNALTESQSQIAAQFGSQFLKHQRFTSGDWDDFAGLPALADAQSNIVCQVRQKIPFGTHTIFIAEVTAVRRRDCPSPLLYHNGRYACVN